MALSLVSLHVLFVHDGMVINAFVHERALEHARIIKGCAFSSETTVAIKDNYNSGEPHSPFCLRFLNKHPFLKHNLDIQVYHSKPKQKV